MAKDTSQDVHSGGREKGESIEYSSLSHKIYDTKYPLSVKGTGR